MELCKFSVGFYITSELSLSRLDLHSSNTKFASKEKEEDNDGIQFVFEAGHYNLAISIVHSIVHPYVK